MLLVTHKYELSRLVSLIYLVPTSNFQLPTSKTTSKIYIMLSILPLMLALFVLLQYLISSFIFAVDGSYFHRFYKQTADMDPIQVSSPCTHTSFLVKDYYYGLTCTLY